VLISCEKCSTTYVLDDALIPPQGTPVQCTRCGHVFTAKPGAGDAPAPIAAAPPPVEKGANNTVMFGAVAAPGPVPKVPPPAANQTMVFGTPSATSQPPPPRAASPSNQTMVFGTQAATQPPGPVPKVNPSSQTMVFGQSPSRPAATAAFGTPAAQPPAAPPKPPLASQTMVFGTQQATAQAPPPVAPPKKGSETMVFGKGAPVGPVPGPTFGTPAATQSRPTMAAITPPANQTQMFGVTAAAAEEEPAPKNQTMMFGRPANAKPIPKVTVGSVEAAGYAANEGTSESTVRVDLENMMGSEAAPAEESIEARHDRTQRYAMTDEAAEPQPLLQPESVEERHNRTVLFAMNPMAERTHPDAAPLKAPADDSNATLMFGNREPEPLVGSVVLDGNLTPPEAHAASPLPQSTLPNLPKLESNDNFAPIQPEDLGPGHGDHGFAGAVDLPPEPSFTADSNLADAAAADDAAVAQVRDSRTRRLTVVVVVLLVAVVALAAALFWFTFGRALVNKDSAQVLQQTQEAVTSLRRDDEGSRVEAIATLRTLLVKSPQAPEVHSALVLALALSCDDLNEEATRAGDTLKRTRARLSTSKDRGPLDERIQKVNARLSELQATLADRQAELHAAQDALDRAAADHELTPEQRFVVVRSRALGAAVLGEGSAIALAEEARQKSVSPDNWADLALPEYVINGGSSFDDALKQLEEVQQRDSTFLRAYVLAARIKVKQNELEGAEEQLGRVLALQPRHEVAGQLHEWIASRQRQAD
jgi:predicted Zn finger-like uncharacterized protein